MQHAGDIKLMKMLCICQYLLSTNWLVILWLVDQEALPGRIRSPIFPRKILQAFAWGQTGHMAK